MPSENLSNSSSISAADHSVPSEQELFPGADPPQSSKENERLVRGDKMRLVEDEGTEILGADIEELEVDGDEQTPDSEETLQEVLTRAYSRMTYAELQQIANLRHLRALPKKSSLVSRIVDNEIRRSNKIGSTVSRKFSSSSGNVNVVAQGGGGGVTSDVGGAEPDERENGSRPQSALDKVTRRVPVEVWSLILECLNDWELAQALGIPTRIVRPSFPSDWSQATPLDHALLTGSIPEIRKVAAAYPNKGFTELSAHAIVRFGYVQVLDYLFHHHRANFREIYEADKPTPNEIAMRIEIPWLASRYGRTQVLDWWYQNSSAPPCAPDKLTRKHDRFYLNMASQFGHINVLEWWKRSGLPLVIGDVMDFATIGGHIPVLEWWLHSGYNTNMLQRDALGIASSKGNIQILEWFKNSGMQLKYENDVLNHATKSNRPEVLQWWEGSGLRAEYIIADIQEAVEECHGTETREWWEKRGITFSSQHGVNPDEWINPRLLKPEQLSKGRP